MFNLFKKDQPSIGFVHFRGNLPTRAEEFRYLERAGVAVHILKPPATAHWSMKLIHPAWGQAEVMCPRDLPPTPTELGWVTTLNDSEKAGIRASLSVVVVKTQPVKKTVLRDRKHLLRYLGAILGDDGVAALDYQSMLWWSRGMLDDELAHDADLDIEALYCTHAVIDDEAAPKEDEEPPVKWLHTHGLAELGAFDFDIVRPHHDATSLAGGDAQRAIAFSILEGKIGPSEADVMIGLPNIRVGFVPAEEFMRRAPASQREAREMGDGDTSHHKKRSVVCEPKRSGLRAVLGGGGVQAAKFFMREMPEQGAFCFTNGATELMALRARQTVGLVPKIAEELRVLSPMIGAKIGYVVDGGGADDREHMWFSVHEIKGDQMDATLEVQPFHIARMTKGERGMHDIGQLTDWMIATPIGTITPRSFRVLRMARENPEKMREVAGMLRAGGEEDGRR